MGQRRMGAEGVVYFLQPEGIPRVKIGLCRTGITSLRDRVKNLQSGCPFMLRVLGVIPSPFPEELEEETQNLFARYRLHHEWFDLTPEIRNHLQRFGVSLEEYERELAKSCLNQVRWSGNSGMSKEAIAGAIRLGLHRLYIAWSGHHAHGGAT